MDDASSTSGSSVLSCQRQLQRLLEDEVSNGPIISDTNGVVVRATPTTAGFDIIHAVGTLHGIGAHEFTAAAWDIEHRKEWDHVTTGTVSEWCVLKTLDKDTDQTYTCSPGMFFVSGREFYDVRRRVELDDGCCAIVISSAEDQRGMPTKPGVVRAKTIFQGMTVRPLGKNGCRVVMCSQIDPGGTVPATMVNRMAAEKPVEWFTSLRENASKLAERYRKGDIGGAVSAQEQPKAELQELNQLLNELQQKLLGMPRKKRRNVKAWASDLDAFIAQRRAKYDLQHTPAATSCEEARGTVVASQKGEAAKEAMAVKESSGKEGEKQEGKAGSKTVSTTVSSKGDPEDPEAKAKRIAEARKLLSSIFMFAGAGLALGASGLNRSNSMAMKATAEATRRAAISAKPETNASASLLAANPAEDATLPGVTAESKTPQDSMPSLAPPEFEAKSVGETGSAVAAPSGLPPAREGVHTPVNIKHW